MCIVEVTERKLGPAFAYSAHTCAEQTSTSTTSGPHVEQVDSRQRTAPTGDEPARTGVGPHGSEGRRLRIELRRQMPVSAWIMHAACCRTQDALEPLYAGKWGVSEAKGPELRCGLDGELLTVKFLIHSARPSHESRRGRAESSRMVREEGNGCVSSQKW